MDAEAKDTTVATATTTAYQRSVRVRSRAWRMLEFRPLERLEEPHPGQQRTSGIASIQRSPRMTVTNSGATTIRPSIAGTVIDADQPRDPEPARATRAGSSWMVENAGKSTSVIGHVRRLEGTSITL